MCDGFRDGKGYPKKKRDNMCQKSKIITNTENTNSNKPIPLMD